jgi:hypothetical protein
MADLLPKQEPSDRRRGRAQFTLRELLLTVNAVAISLAMFVWLRKETRWMRNDSWALIALVIPSVAVFLLPLGSLRRKLRITVVATLLAFGIAWSLLFPKNPDIFCPGMFASIATAVGLFGAALVLIALWRRPAWLGVLVVALFWSLLWGLVRINLLRYTGW